ncbi:NUDIX hydrolase [Geoalkalibacter sp.]|uniref:NUDIX hydrolase n=1 Tax=Geoalkalibacter sp. TaxID=3041440 RepID=UPI00272DD570|nr:NUDIX hydrolase [Geoalkalibacter sp.]
MPRMVEKIFEGRIVSLNLEEHELPDGRRAVFEMVRHPGGAAILPLLDDGRVLLIRQFRPAGGGMVWEIPAGRLEPGESPEDCVRREIQEELGYRAGQVDQLGEMLTAVGFCDEIVHLYLGRALEPVERALEPDEYIEVVPMPYAEALSLVTQGEIPDGKTQLALLLAQQKGWVKAP